MRKIVNLIASFVPWREGGTYVLRDEQKDMMVCVGDTANLFLFPEHNLLDGIREGDERTMYVQTPRLEQKPMVPEAGFGWEYSPVLTCFMLNKGQIIVGQDEFALTQRDVYPAFSRLTEGAMGIAPGMRFHVWFAARATVPGSGRP
jgi:hypothetical protein